MTSTPIVSIPVGVTVERRMAESPWADALWRPVSVLAGTPTAAPWTPIDSDPNVTTYYAGQAVIELYRTETGNYRSNVASGAPLLWVVLRPTGIDPPFDLLAVTADPAEGEALTGAGNDLVESVPMIDSINTTIRAFIAEYHVERSMFKRQRDRAGMRPVDENLK
jgi:Protein of unknown function (DUF3305)